MSGNAGYATLQIIPSAKDFGKRLRDQTESEINKFGKEVGASLGEELAGSAGDKLSDELPKVGKETGAKLGDELAAGVGNGLSERIGEEIGTGVADALSAADRVAKRSRWFGIRSSITSGLTEAFNLVMAKPKALVSFGRNMIQAVGRSVTSGFRTAVDTVKKDGFLGLAKNITSSLGGAVKNAFNSASAAATKFVSDFVDSASSAVKNLSSSALSAVSGAVSSGFSTIATGGLSLILGGLLAVLAALPAAVATLVGSFLALAPVALLLGGVLGTVFTVMAGGIGTVGVLLLAFHGLGAAFTELSQNGKISSKTLKTLAPSARSFVQEIVKLRAPLKDLAKFVQGKFFAGLGKDVASLAKVWLPALRPMLGGLATDFNAFAKSVIGALSNKQFVKNIQSGVGAFGVFIVRLGQAMAPFIDAFGRLARASVPFLSALGDGIAKVAAKFDAWITSASKSGALTTFMDNAVADLHEISRIGGLVGGIISDLIKTFFPQSKSASNSFLGGVTDSLAQIKAWLDDPKNQKRLRDWVGMIEDFYKKLVTQWIPAVAHFFASVAGWISKIDGWAKKISDFGDKTQISLSKVGNAFKSLGTGAAAGVLAAVKYIGSLPGKILSGVSSLNSEMFNVGKDAADGLTNGLLSKIGSVLSAGANLGKSLLNAARGALDSHSPSREFIKIGGDVADGLTIGITRGNGQVTKAMRDLATPPDMSAGATSGAVGANGALVGSLTINPGKGETTKEALDEALFALRRIARGGVYA